jgi:hypothetical protein
VLNLLSSPPTPVAAMAPSSLFRRTIIAPTLGDRQQEGYTRSFKSISRIRGRKKSSDIMVNTLNPYTMQPTMMDRQACQWLCFGGRKLHNGFSKLTRRWWLQIPFSTWLKEMVFWL